MLQLVPPSSDATANPSSLAFVYPGQGTQRVGMGSWFCHSSAPARHVFEEASAILGFDIRSLCESGPQTALTQTRNAQPAIFVCNAAADAVLRSAGLRPAYVAGHSLGEFNALVAAGVMDFAAALELVQHRAALMSRITAPGLMGAIAGFPSETVELLCALVCGGDRLVVALENAPDQIVVSGDRAAVERCLDEARRQGARRARVLSTSHAFHSPLMAEIVSDWASVVERVHLRSPSIPLAMNATGNVVSSVTTIRRAIIDQVTSRVRWTSSIRALLQRGARPFVESGDSNVLSRFHRSIVAESRCFSLKGKRDLVELLAVSPVSKST